VSAGDDLLVKLSQPVKMPVNLDRLELLLNDYLASLIDGNALDERGLARDGAIGFGAYLSMLASSKDRDDVDWTLGAHFGAIVWSTIFPLCMKDAAFRKNAIAAAYSGYQAGTSIGNFLGVSHRMKWHVTATAGAVASASAASVMLGLTPAQHQNSLRLAITNMAGSAKAPREREGAAAFNRAAATSLGLVSAMSDARSIDELWDESRGIFELYSSTGGDAIVTDGVATASIRPFATNGFCQSAVLAASKLSARSQGELKSIEVHIAQGIAPILDGSRGGSWWTLKSSVASAWASKDPTQLLPAAEIEKLVSVIPGDVGMGAAKIVAKTSQGEDSYEQISPPGVALDVPEEQAWARAKWNAMAGSRALEISQWAKDFVSNKPNEKLWNFFDEIAKSAH